MATDEQWADYENEFRSWIKHESLTGTTKSAGLVDFEKNNQNRRAEAAAKADCEAALIAFENSESRRLGDFLLFCVFILAVPFGLFAYLKTPKQDRNKLLLWPGFAALMFFVLVYNGDPASVIDSVLLRGYTRFRTSGYFAFGYGIAIGIVTTALVVKFSTAQTKKRHR